MAEDYVTFEDSSGNVISNDPRWHAAKTLRSGGVDVDDLQREVDELRAFKAAHSPAQSGIPGDLVEDAETDEDDDESANDYSTITGSDLVNLAKARSIELTHEDGTKLKAAEVREALAAQDAESE